MAVFGTGSYGVSFETLGILDPDQQSLQPQPWHRSLVTQPTWQFANLPSSISILLQGTLLGVVL